VNNHRIRKIELNNNNKVTTVAGSTAGYANGNGTAIRFNRPHGLCYVSGALYIADFENHCIRRIVWE
jgi:hypothetical protein